MLPAIVVFRAQVHLYKWPPLRPFRFADEMQTRLLRRAVRLLGIALDAGANNVLPSGRATSIARDHVIEIQITPVEDLAAILAGVVITLEDIMARKLHFLFRHSIKEAKQDHARHADAE